MNINPSQAAGAAAGDVDGEDLLDAAIRFGLLVYGVVHLIIGWTALQIVLGGSQSKASSSGAMQQLGDTPLGSGLLWAVAAGFVALVLWRVLEAYGGFRSESDDTSRTLKRVLAGGKAIVYALLAWSAIQVALGRGSSGGTDSTTSKLMSVPAGQVLVGSVGLGIVVYGVRLVTKGWSEKFRKDLEAQGQSGRSGRAYVVLGKVGHVAKGLAMVIVGALFGFAALTHDPHRSGGLDAALKDLAAQPFGDVLLVAIALGLVCFGLYSFARARHLDR